MDPFTYRQGCEQWGPERLRTRVRRGEVVRLLNGIYAEAGDPDPWLLHRAALLAAPPGSALADLSAAALLASMVDIPARPQLVTPTPVRIAGVDSRCTLVPDDRLTQRLGLVSTGGDLTAADCLRRLPRVQAVVTVDRLLNTRRATMAGIATVLDAHAGERGVARARQRLTEAEPKSDSPGETRLRLVLVDGGLPRPQAQVRIADPDGGFIAWGDLGWPPALCGHEYVGDVHLERSVAARDRRRRKAIKEHTAWEMEEVGAPEMRRPQHIVMDAREQLGRRCPRPAPHGVIMHRLGL